jgi:hypothetical protein
MSKKKSTVTLDALRATSDPRVIARSKIAKQFATLKARGVHYMKEQQFMREAGVNQIHLKLVKAEYTKHVVAVNEVGAGNKAYQVWFPNPADATIIRKEQEQIRRALARDVTV